MTGRISENPTISNLFLVDNMTIAVICDASHVLKLIRNLLYNKGMIKMSAWWQNYFQLESNEIRWEVIEEVVRFQEKHECKIAPKLKAKTLERGKSHFGKMDVGCALSVFSKDVSACIEYMVQHHDYPMAFLTTAQFIYWVAHWYEILSCQYYAMAFSLEKPEVYAEVSEFLEVNFPLFFASLEIYPDTKQPHAYADVQIGVLMTCHSTTYLRVELIEKQKQKFFMAGRTLGDTIESHHGQTKGCVKHPTSLQVERISKALAVTQVLGPVKHSNCQGDASTHTLADFKLIKQLELEKGQDEIAQYEEDMQLFISHDGSSCFDLETDQGLAESNSVSFWIGCVLKRTILSKFKKGCYCEKCIKILVEKPEEDSMQLTNELIDIKIGEGKTLIKRNRVKPTKLCNDALLDAEASFRLNRHLFFGKKKMGEKLVGFIKAELRAKYELPCHFNSVLRKFILGRIYFWKAHMNENGREVNAESVEEASNASRTARQAYIVQ